MFNDLSALKAKQISNIVYIFTELFIVIDLGIDL